MEKQERQFCPLLMAAVYIARSQGAKMGETKYQCQGEKCAFWEKNVQYFTERAGVPGWCVITRIGGR